MVDINDDARRVRGELQSGVVRRRRWTAEEKGRVVAEAVAPGAVIAAVARRHDLAPQHLSNWIRAAKDGRFALPCDGRLSFVPAVVGGPREAEETSRPGGAAPIEITLGSVMVRIAAGADRRLVEVVLRMLRPS
ncbi:MAG: transposase [Reyranella sp.]|nr:transposase [Reyranella sp.]